MVAWRAAFARRRSQRAAREPSCAPVADAAEALGESVADLADETLAYCRAAAVQLGGPSYEAAEARVVASVVAAAEAARPTVAAARERVGAGWRAVVARGSGG